MDWASRLSILLVFSVICVVPVDAEDWVGPQDVDVYNRACRKCYGSAGDGRGFEAWMMGIKLRDLSAGTYKYSSKLSGAPTSEDVERVIGQGIPRTSMPHHTMMSAADKAAVVRYLRHRFPEQYADSTSVVEIPNVPVNRMTPASVARGRHLFRRDQCHGHEALAMGQQPGYSRMMSGERVRILRI